MVLHRACARAFQRFQLPAFDVDLDQIGSGQGSGGDIAIERRDLDALRNRRDRRSG